MTIIWVGRRYSSPGVVPDIVYALLQTIVCSCAWNVGRCFKWIFFCGKSNVERTEFSNAPGVDFVLSEMPLEIGIAFVVTILLRFFVVI